MFSALEMSKVGWRWLSCALPRNPFQAEVLGLPGTSSVACRWLPAEPLSGHCHWLKSSYSKLWFLPIQSLVDERVQKTRPLLQLEITLTSYPSSRSPCEVNRGSCCKDIGGQQLADLTSLTALCGSIRRALPGEHTARASPAQRR